MNSEMFAYIGGFLVIACLVPQIIKSYKTKSTRDLSLYMILLALLGGFSYTFFGILIRSKALILTNLIYCVLAVLQLYFKICPLLFFLLFPIFQGVVDAGWVLSRLFPRKQREGV